MGGRIVEMFHLNGWATVRPVVRQPQALIRACRFALDGRIADGFDTEALRAAFAGCDGVVHAIAGSPSTILGTLEPVYRAAEACGVRRLVYLSSASVHGQSPTPGTTEASRLSERQSLAYNNTKVRAERLLGRLRSRGRVEVVYLRPGIVYGPRSYWIGGLADELLAAEAYLVGGGLGICNSAYVDNVVHAIRLALSTPAADRQAYLIGDAEEVTWADLCRPVAEALGIDFEHVPRPGPTWTAGRPSLRERLRRVRGSPLGRSVLAALPVPLREGLRAGLAASRREREASGAPPEPQVTEERAMLHTCRYRLPWTKAETELGYLPIVSFAEGCRRSIGWLAYAGYPVVRGPGLLTTTDTSGRVADAGRD
jgi:nucleoside-diphosphate-sugar epimerase